MIGMLEYGGSGMLGGARSAVMALGVDMHRVRRIGLGLLFAGHLGASERGALPSEIFDVQAMEGASMSTDVAEQADGRLLVANMRGLFRYDGSRWQLYLHPDAKGGMEHLAIDSQGRIHTSFNGDIGWWQDDASGSLTWHSEMQRLPPGCSDVAAETTAVVVDERRGGVVYAAATRIAFLPLEAAIPARCAPMSQLVKAFLADGDLLAVLGTPTRLVRLNGDFQAEPVSGSEVLDGVGISSVTTGGSGTLLLNNNGQVLRYQSGQLLLYSNALQTLARQGGTRPFFVIHSLKDGRHLVAGVLDGLHVLDAGGALVDHLDAGAGVPAQRRTAGMHQDRNGDLWLAQERSIVRLGIDGAVSVHDERHGLPSAVQIARWRGALWVASRSGLFRLDVAGNGASYHTPVPGLVGLFGVAALTDDALLVIHGGLRAVRPAAGDWRVDTLDGPWNQVSVLEPSRFVPGRAYAGYAQGLLQIDYQRDGTIGIREIGSLGIPVARIAEQDADTLWVADRVDGVLRVTLDDPRHPVKYGAQQGLPAGTVRIYAGPRRPWFTTLEGLRVYDEASDRFVVPAGLPPELQQDRLYSAYEDQEGHLWVRGGAILNDVFWRTGSGWRIDRDLMHAVDPFPTIFGFQREGDVVWAIRANGLLRFDLRAHRPTPPPPAPILSAVFDTRARVALPLAGLTRLAPAVRDLRVEYTLPFLRRGGASQYRSRLRGFEDWSDWTASGQQTRIYTNLPDGEFAFEVEARDALQRELRMAAVPLHMTPPWFRTPLANLLYITIAILSFVLAMRLGARRRQRQMLARQRELETTVAARTAELAISNQRLAAQAERLAEVDRMKTRFFTNVGHEFRTPLTLVLGPLDDLLQGTRGRLADGVRTHLQLAQRNARRVLDLIVELLDVNRLEQGQMPLRMGRHDLASLLKRVAAEAEPLLARYGQELKTDLPPVAPAARVDPVQIERCVLNLLSNAAKYSPRGGLVELSLAHDAKDWIISVGDHGRGIPEHALAHVFDRFFQTAEGDHATGHGIGLSLAREIALAHGGDISVSSALGVGSVFSLRIPATIADQPAAVEPTEAVSVPGSVPAVAPAERGRERVLVIDDHDDLRARVRGLLESRFEVLEASDGETAWKLVCDALPDLIVSDVMMPGCDGVELTRRVRAHEDTAAIGLLLLTAKAGSEHAVAGLRAGANDYLAKPFDSSELMARCEAIVSHARRLQHRLAAAAPVLPAEVIETPDSRWRQRLDAHIEASLHNAEFGVEELASAMHTDRTHLFRRCKELLGMSPSDYLRELRLSHAHRLLEAAAGNVSEVAYASGFDSLSSFTRAFRNRHGYPPSKVQRREAS